MLRALARLAVFLFSAIHWLASSIVGAHLTVLRNFASRESVERKQVKRD